MIALIYVITLPYNNIMMMMQSAITEAVRLGSQEMVVALVTLFSSTSSQPYQVINKVTSYHYCHDCLHICYHTFLFA